MTNKEEKTQNWSDWVQGKKVREYEEKGAHILEVVESISTDQAQSSHSEKTLTIRLDPQKINVIQATQLLLALSDLYRAIGGEGLIILRGTAFASDVTEIAVP